MKLKCPECGGAVFRCFGIFIHSSNIFFLQCTDCKNAYLYDARTPAEAEELTKSESYVPIKELVVETGVPTINNGGERK